MKKLKKFKGTIFFGIIGIIFCIVGYVNAAVSYDSSLVFKRIKSLCVPVPYSKDGTIDNASSIYGLSKPSGMSDKDYATYKYNYFSSVQAFTWTDKYFVFMLTSPKNDLDLNERNGLYVMEYNETDNKYQTASVGYKNKGYISLVGRNGDYAYNHANDITYVPKSSSGASKDLIAITYRFDSNDTPSGIDKRARVTFIDAETFAEVNTIFLPYNSSFGSIAYDRDNNKFYLGHGTAYDSSVGHSYTSILECDVSISGGKITFNGDSNCYKSSGTLSLDNQNLNKIPLLHLGGGAEIHDGYYYKVDYDSGESYSTTPKNKGTTLGTRGGFIQSISMSNIKKAASGSNLGVSKRYGVFSDHFLFDDYTYAEIEGITYKGNTPYFVINNGRPKECIATVFRPNPDNYEPPKSINLKAKVSTNKSDLLSKTSITATIKGLTSGAVFSDNVSYDKSVGGYLGPSTLHVNEAGKYQFEIKQNSIDDSNWTIDSSTLKATANVRYSLNSNNLINDVSFTNGKDTFTNTYNYPEITVPISVKVTTNKDFSELSTPTTTGLLTSSTSSIPSIDTASASDNTYSYSLKFSKAGTYTYSIEQANSGTHKSGQVVTDIDSTKITVTIKVTENSDKLSYSVSYSPTSFTNKISMEYDKISASVSVNINTTRENTDIPIPITTATLKKDGSLVTASNSSNGKYSYNISLSEPGIYVYTIEQAAKAGEGIYEYTLDSKKITLTIVVNGSADGLVVVQKILSSNAFNNTVIANYSGISVNIKQKINTNKSSSSIPIPTTSCTVTRNGSAHTVNNSGEYYNYSETINKPGAYTYIVKQNSLSNTSNYIYELDNSTLTYVVNVTSESGVLKYTVTPTSGEFTNNVYSVLKPELKIKIETAKTGSATIKTSKAALYDSDNNKIGEVSSSSNYYTFSSLISITKAGTYTYTIKQTTSDEKSGIYSYSYDKGIITVTIKVTKDSTGLHSTISYSKDSFSNTITTDSINVPISVDVITKKDLTELETTNTTAVLTSNSNETISSDTASKTDNKYSFNVSLNVAGTYTYYISQSNSGITKNGMVVKNIDSSKITVTIKVTESNNKLESTVEYSKDAFTNILSMEYEKINVPVSIDINTTKESSDIPTPVTTAILKEGSTTKQTSVSSNNKYSFSLDINVPGIYVYTIEQSAKSGEGIYEYTLDSKKITLTIVVNGSTDGLVAESVILSANSFSNKVVVNYNEISINLSAKINTNKSSSSIPTPTTSCTVTRDGSTHTVTNSGEYYNYSEKIDKEGTYTYKVKQNSLSNTSNYIYEIDNSTLTYVVNVTSESGVLKYTVTPTSAGFTNNVYSVLKPELKVKIETSKPTDAQIKTTKAVLYDSDNEKVGEVSSSSNYYTFSSLISITKAGTYTYTIKQTTSDEKSGIYSYSYDKGIITVTIKVTKDSTGLHSTISYSKDSFSNTITTDSINVPISVDVITKKDLTELETTNTTAVLTSSLNETISSDTASKTDNKYSFNVSLNVAGTYTYYISQSNSGITKNGMVVKNIDSSKITVTIKVTDSNNKLESIVEYSKDAFTNILSMEYDKINVPVSIDINTEKASSYIPTPVTTANLTEGSTIKQTSVSSNNKYSFSLDINVPGIYVYSVDQLPKSNEGVYEYTLDSKKITLTIVVNGSTDGLVAESVILSANSFNNTAIANYNEISVNLEGKINTFKSNDDINTPITSAIISDESKIHAVSSTLEKYNYIEKINKPGKYTYTIKQNNYTDTSDYIYEIDNSTLTYVVDVTDDNGVLKYTITSAKKEFNNYIYTSLEPEIKVGIKTDNPSDVQVKNTKAALYNSDNVKIGEVSSNNNYYTFSNLINITKVGTYTYKINQTSTDETSGVYVYSYDKGSITVTIKVTKDNTGLHSTVSYSKDSFSNNIIIDYEDITVNLETIIHNDFETNDLSSKTTSASFYYNDTLLENVNSSLDKYSYNVVISEPGVYVYKVKQNQSGIVEHDDCLILMDSSTKVITVNVIASNGKLISNITFDNSDNTFNNEYSTKKEPVSVPISVSVNTIKQKDSISTPKTTASLYDKDGNKVQSVTIDNDKYTFSSVDFIKEQTAEYTIKQDKTGEIKDGIYLYNYDSSVKRVTIKVYNYNNKLKYEVIYDGAETTSFNNTVSIKYDSIYRSLTVKVKQTKKTNDSSNLVHLSNKTSSDLKKINNNLLKINNSTDNTNNITSTANLILDDEVVSTATLDNDEYTFNNIKIDDVGEYNFKVVQTGPSVIVDNGIKTEFDDTIIDVVVNVEDINGLLNVKSTTYSDEEFENIISEVDEEDTKFSDVTIKVDLYSKASDISSEGFKATLLENDIPIQTVTNSNGKYKFENLKLSKGNYNYKIKQLRYNELWEMDTSVLEVEVIVEEDLSYSLKFKDDVNLFINNKKEDSVIPESERPLLINVPDTSFFSDYYLYIIGLFFLIGGLIISALKFKKQNNN